MGRRRRTSGPALASERGEPFQPSTPLSGLIFPSVRRRRFDLRFRKKARKKNLDRVEGKSKRHRTFWRVGGENAVPDQAAEEIAGSTFFQSRDAVRVPALQFAALQSLFEEREGFRLEVAPFNIEFEASDETVEVEQAGHEIHLVKAHFQKPGDEFVERTAREIAAPVKIALPWHISMVHHSFVVAAACKAAGQPA